MSKGGSAQEVTRRDLADAVERIRAEARASCASGRLPGFVAGVYHGGAQAIVADGVANLGTGDAMTEETGFLAGSITKVMTATLLMQCIERGQVDLEERVRTYLPEFTLAPPAKVDEIRIRHLLNHTNGIDADLFWPDAVGGRDALRYMVGAMRTCGTLFDPGEYVSYSNGGMLVAGRVLEVVTGRTYHELLEREIFAPSGMTDSCTSAAQAILRRTAVGHFPDPATGRLRRTDMFMLPESWSACGATPLVTIGDLLAFARVHLGRGLAATGARLLSAESTQRMQEMTVDMGTPNAAPIGLGWPLFPFGRTTILTHSGASPGGTATLMVVPEHDFAFATYGNSGAAIGLADRLAQWLLGEHLGIEDEPVAWKPVEVSDVGGCAGTYRSNQFRAAVAEVGGRLEETMTFEPADEQLGRTLAGFVGGVMPFPARSLVPLAPRLFAPAGVPLEAFRGFGGRMLVSFHGGTPERPAYRMVGGRMTRRSA